MRLRAPAHPRCIQCGWRAPIGRSQAPAAAPAPTAQAARPTRRRGARSERSRDSLPAARGQRRP
eukprot:537829-Alexandrium_andersonii.AAC.1